MAASLRPLSLPPPLRDGGEDGGDGDETDTSIRGWDRSVLADLPDDLHNNGNGRRTADEGEFDCLPIAARARSATFHAVAHGRSVVGTSPCPLGSTSSNNDGNDDDMTDESDESRGILWQTSLDDEVVAVASNADGSVVAAATATHVSLLKGRDGSVLATRQITDDEGSGAGSCPPRLLFLSNRSNDNECDSSDREDILAVVCPVAPGNHSGRSNVILIGNIDGKLLNSPDLTHVREGASKMSMELLPFDSADSRSVAWMEGAFVNLTTVRLFLGRQGEGVGPSASVCVYDYDVSEKKSRLVLGDLGGHLGHVDDSTVLVGAGIDDKRPMGMHLLLATATAGEASSSSAISWINVVDLNTSAKYQLPQGAVVVSCAPVQSHAHEAEGEYVAAALACRGPAGSEMVVVQSMASSDGQDAEGDAMVLLKLSVEDANDDVEVYAPNPIDGRGPYSFRYRNSRRAGDDATVGACWEFTPNDQSRLGTLHSLLVQKRFEDAHGVVEEMVRHPPDHSDRVSSPMDKTLMSLMHFRHILSGDISSETNQAEALECLRRLTTGVIASSGGGRELEGMASAAEYLVGWPQNQPSSSTGMHSIREVSVALVAMSTAIKTAVDVVGASKAMELEEQRQRLDERLMALKALKGIIPAFDAAQIACDEPYLAVASTVELLSLFVAKGAFKAAEELQGSEFGKEAGLSRPDVLAGAALRLPMTVDPRAFVAWLSDVVLPSMPIGHPMLGKIRSWACRAADKYDEEDIAQGIDSSIELLQAVAAATACQTETNRCYDYATEQDLDEEDMTDSITPRNDDPASSFCTTSSTRSISSYRPSVLSVGMISGGAAKRANGGRTMMSARRRAGRVSNNSSLDFSFLSPTSSSPGSTEASFAEEDEDEEDETINCVESKLREALRLKAARRLGLERDCLTLTNYPSKGEEYIMKELVRSALDKSSTEPSCDLARVVSELRSYADSVGADFDEALCSIANELCNDNTDDIPTVLRQTEKLSEWCSTPSKKCSIVLRMLRKALVSVNRPPDLSSLASEAIGLAADDETRSELKEAARLLAIDSLVRKYCGNGAQEYFRVSDPLHGLKLVQHVCRHIHKSTVLTDALMLCDAFTHVSKLDTCVSLLQRVMASQTARKTGVEDPTHSAAQCASFMSEIYSRDAILAERVGERMAGYCAGMLEDCRKAILLGAFPGKEEAKRQAAVSTAVACSVLSVMRDQHASVAPRMLKEFQQLSKLQSGCGIFLTIEELRDPSSRVEVVTDLLKPCVELLRRGSLKTEDDSLRQELKPLIAMARQWTAILCDAPSDVSQLWSRAIGTAASQIAKVSTNHASLLLLEVSGLLVGQDGHSSFHSLMSVALSLCDRASSEAHGLSRSLSLGETDLLISLVAMRSMAQASLLLRDYVLLHSPSDMLPSSLALANLTELVCDICTQSDKGIGEKLERYIETLQTLGPKRQPQTQGISEKSDRMMTDKRIPSAPNLHPTWYIGDGLLLQPLDALFLSVAYFKMMRGLEPSSSPSNAISSSANTLMSKSDMVQALESRGAHTTSLRVLVLSMATVMPQSSSQSPFPNAEGILKKNHGVLAERSLGGTELGFTCGNIDVLMSASFLLHLPKEQAFKIYQAALPSAISERDFSRIVTLASIGMHCGVGAFSSGESFPWSKQRRFIDQCRDLSLNAVWWRIFSQYGVSFDPAAFSQSDESKSSVDMQAYCEKLVWSAAPTKLGPRSTLKLARRFMKDYGLNKQAPTTSLIEFLLSAPHCDSANTEKSEARLNKNDIRRDLRQTESVVRECLVLLPTLNQSKVLRKCVMNLEKDQRCAKDYDRHSMILQLYRECLDKLSPVMKKNAVRAKAHEQETGCIDRRQDALVVIASIFEKYPSDKRPEYTKLFEALPPDPLNPGQDTRKLSVLGAEAGDCVVDPLAPLDGILEDENGSNSIVAALAPLCSLLQLPAGYLHARSLVVRFRKLNATGGVPPPFDAAVVPVAKKLRATRDRADLAWWCSLQYAAGSVEQLKCLDMAHANATEASELAESLQDPEEENVALERVKRIDAARAGLSDKILVEQVLQRHESTTNAVKTLYRSIMDKVQQQAQTEENYCPEHLVRALLIEGSQIAATASLDDTDAFSTHHFRSLALIVHDACKSLSSRYSHVSVGKCVRLLTRRWLVHGDELEDNFDVDPGDRDDPTNNTTEEQAKNNVRANDENEDTSEFVMDIGMISAGEQHWSNHQARNDNSGPGTNSNVEPSALKPNSPRESSDHLCLRIALRIAFLVCFAEDYHRATDSLPEKSTALEDIDTNVKRHKLKSRSKGVLKSRQKSACFEGDLALQHARELLGIVFARQGSTIASAYGSLFDESAAFDESMLSTVPEHSAKEEFHGKNKALSFAMRYRALRVATILCPQEVIMRVAVEESYGSDFGDDHLNKGAFGSFVAMEIEALKLALPHSDLIQFSTINFPSYGRTLWRNYGGNSSHGVNGRLHLLLLELCINDRSEVDWELFVLMFGELTRLELPRSLLLACEIAAKSKAIALAASQKRLDVLQSVEDATSKIAEFVVNEVKANLGAGTDISASECHSTLHRLVSVVINKNIHTDPTCIVRMLIDASSSCKEQGQEAIGDVFTKAAIRITDHLTEPGLFCSTRAIINGCDASSEWCGRSVQQSSACDELVASFENSFY